MVSNVTYNNKVIYNIIIMFNTYKLVICVTTDKQFSKIPSFLQPLYIGFALLAIGIAYGANCGYALNPVSFFFVSSINILILRPTTLFNRQEIWVQESCHLSVVGVLEFSGTS